MSGVLKRLDDISQTLVRLAGELKQCVEDVRLVSSRQMERLEQERASALLAASVDAHVEAEQVSLHNVEEAEAKKFVQMDLKGSSWISQNDSETRKIKTRMNGKFTVGLLS
ncbi:hypothetical protein O3G_MSEX000464 [Manduca sexta]|nr:hypothetical protein O3G_MSEX000464 [Manduca sexta]